MASSSVLCGAHVSLVSVKAQHPRAHQRATIVSKPASPLLSGSMMLKASPMIARLGKAQRPKRDVTSMSLFGLGGPELLVIGAVAAIVFGPSKLPELGKGLGKTVKSFQGAAEEFKNELNAAATKEEEEAKKEEEGQEVAQDVEPKVEAKVEAKVEPMKGEAKEPKKE
eukprot:CAMPEP_0198198386 /NCGR_PEP_ID=MMETSP1445-20131203/1858_1 /TAXON_ID=36898 /ORGANISM="Pyramimonas sp., Strain CCMP2087" /LENGTH=167 /DNA_ID=CAMNT_0043867935 /DNA_START=48 /DNA_END=551 /DNA_ORIENTATION=-